MGITKTEWLKALGEAERPSDLPDGQTAIEIAATLGMSAGHVAKKLKARVRSGELEQGRRRTATGWTTVFAPKRGKK